MFPVQSRGDVLSPGASARAQHGDASVGSGRHRAEELGAAHVDTEAVDSSMRGASCHTALCLLNSIPYAFF